MIRRPRGLTRLISVLECLEKRGRKFCSGTY